MQYLFVRQKVADYKRWLAVFESHAQAHKEAGLKDVQILRDAKDPGIVVCFFTVADIDKARASTDAPQASNSQKLSGVIGFPEVLLLDEV